MMFDARSVCNGWKADIDFRPCNLSTSPVTEEFVTEIEIDSEGRLLIKPAHSAFSDLYRAGAWGFRWEESTKRLVGPKPEEWLYTDWFRHIVTVIASQYGLALRLAPTATWISVSPELRQGIEDFDRSGWPAKLERQRHRDSTAYWARLELEQALSEAGRHWDRGDFEGFSHVLTPFEQRLSPAQSKRLKIARSRVRQS